MKKILIMFLPLLFIFCLASCDNENDYDENKYIQASYSYTFSDFATRIVVNTDSKIESKKRVNIYYGAIDRYGFYNPNKNSLEYDLMVSFKITRSCCYINDKKIAELYNKVLYSYEGRLGDIVDLDYYNIKKKIVDELSIGDLYKDYQKNNRYYGTLSYTISIESLTAPEEYPNYVGVIKLGERFGCITASTRLYYQIVDDKIYFLPEIPEAEQGNSKKVK